MLFLSVFTSDYEDNILRILSFKRVKGSSRILLFGKTALNSDLTLKMSSKF